MPKYRDMSEKVNYVVEHYHKGIPVSKISSKTQISISSIYRILSKHGFEVHTDIKRKIPPKYWNGIAELYNLGYSTNVIGEYLGNSPSGIAHILEMVGTEFRNRRDSRLISNTIPRMFETVGDDEWLLNAEISEIIEKMRLNVSNREA